MISREFPPVCGGLGFYVYYLSKELTHRGHEVNVITRGNFSKYTYEDIDGIKLFKAPFLPIYPLHMSIHGFFVNKLVKSMENNLDIIHLHSPLPPPIITSLPVITTFHSPCKRAFDKIYRDTNDVRSFFEQLQTMVVYPPIESRLIKLSSKITTVSPSVSEELRLYGLNPKGITVVENAVDPELFTPVPSIVKKHSLILFVGILRSGKGVLDLINCAKSVCNKRPNVRFLVCGDGPLLNKMRSKVEKMGLQKEVIFLGYVNRHNIVKLYQEADILLHPSSHEGLSTVVLEAMSCGLSVVANDIPGNRAVISPGVNGILVVNSSPESLADSILHLLDSDILRRDIGRAARATIENRFSWSKTVDKMIGCYEELLNNKVVR
jgi:glycosyltransferase involved in cell wall biosynthesis